MPTLVIHAPDRRAREGATSFEQILGAGIGDGYAIWTDYVNRIYAGCTVVLLRKDKNKLRAEGRLVKFVGTGRFINGVQRYDVHFKNMIEVPYKPERLNHYGVAVVD